MNLRRWWERIETGFLISLLAVLITITLILVSDLIGGFMAGLSSDKPTESGKSIKEILYKDLRNDLNDWKCIKWVPLPGSKPAVPPLKNSVICEQYEKYICKKNNPHQDDYCYLFRITKDFNRSDKR
jgi:hypothetical protein